MEQLNMIDILDKALDPSETIFTVIASLAQLDIDQRVDAINKIKLALHEISPFNTEPVDEHYIKRFRSFIKGWQGRGYIEIPDEAPKTLEDKHWAPSWRRMCKVLLRNDWWCKGLGLTQPKSAAYGKFLEMKKEKAKNHDGNS